MLSKTKLTFSLTSIIVLIAFGLVCFAPSAFADGDANVTHFDIDVKIGAAESMIDVDARGTADDIQIVSGRDRADRDIIVGTALTITLLVEFSQKVELISPDKIAADALDPEVELMSAHAFGPDDIYLRAFDKEGRPLGELTLDKVSTDTESIVAFRDKGAPSQQFLVRIDEDELTNAYRTLLRTASNAGLEIYNVVCFIPQGYPNEKLADHDAKLADGRNQEAVVGRGVRKADLAHATAHIFPDAHQHVNKASNRFRVDLVDDDQGDPQYAKLTSSSTRQWMSLHLVGQMTG